MNFANSLKVDQTQPNMGPDLDPNCLSTQMVLLKDFFKRSDFEKKDQNINKKTACKELKQTLRD